MIFSDAVFITVFLPVLLVLYYTVGRLGLWFKNFILLAAGLLFYAWGGIASLWLLLVSCFATWVFGILIGREKAKRRKKALLWIAIIFYVGILFLFKYYNFTADSINEALQMNALRGHSLAMPIGISFFTFRAMTYIINTYRGENLPEKNLARLVLYLSFFPQIMSGPIVNYRDMQGELRERRESFELFSGGLCRFVLGLAKKLFLVSGFAIIADSAYGLTQLWHTQYLVPASLAWLGSVAYTLQIFLDFSSYSDMAIGLSAMFGFHTKENFDYPYTSVSVSEFWRRWHISLTDWFREYVYFPLGGSRVVNRDIMVRNLLIVWLLTGIWHGANWTFLLWGLWNFIFLFGERLVMAVKRPSNSFGWHLYTLAVVHFGWVIFRAEYMEKMAEYLRNMFGLNGNGLWSPYVAMFLKEYFLVFVIGLMACVPFSFWKRKAAMFAEKAGWVHAGVWCDRLYPVGMAALFLAVVCYVVRSGYQPFIYFNF